MTLERLQQHFELRKSLLKDMEILQSLRDRAYPGGQNLTGMPRGSGVYDKVGTLAIEIVAMEELIAELQAQVSADERGDRRLYCHNRRSSSTDVLPAAVSALPVVERGSRCDRRNEHGVRRKVSVLPLS